MSSTKPRFRFNDLRKYVIHENLCIHCGSCEAVCPVKVIKLVNYFPTLVGECTSCERCIHSCPKLVFDFEQLQQQVFPPDIPMVPPIGRVIESVSARTNNDTVLDHCQDGGVVTQILLELLDKGYVDSLIVSQPGKEDFTAKPMVATDPEEIIAAGGARYTPSPNLIPLREAIYDRKCQK